MKKKLFIIVENNVAINYGIGTYIENLTQSLSLDFTIYVIRLFTDNQSVERYFKDDIIYVNFPYPQKTNEFEYRYFRRILFFIQSNLEMNELIYFHFNNRLMSFLQMLKKNFQNAKYIYTIHYLDWRVFPGLQRVDFEQLEKMQLHEKKCIDQIYSLGVYMKEFDKIITLSSTTYDIVTKYYLVDAKKVSYIPNCICDIYSKELSLNKNRIKAELGFDCDEKICLFVGRIVPNKGIVELIQAFKRVILKENKCRLIIVGDGNYDLCLSEISPQYSKISFTGYIGKDLLIKLYHIADLGILPSYFEECNYAVLEMMSSQLPFIITDVPGLKDFLDGNDLLVVPCFDVDSLADSMFKLLQSSSLRKEYSQKVRLKFEKKYNIISFRRQMLTIYV